MDWLPSLGQPLDFSDFSVHVQRESDDQVVVSIREQGKDKNIYANTDQHGNPIHQTEGVYMDVC